MPRSKNAVASRARRKKILDQAKGFYGKRKNVYTVAKNIVEKGLTYSYVGRKLKKREYRQLWIARINAAVREEGMTYSQFINKLNINQPYIVLNEKAGPGEVIAPIPIGDDLRSQFRIIHVEPLTDSLFDWIPIFENASHIACFDSGPANLIDQLNLKVSKTLYLRSSALFTPVFASGWNFP